MRKKISEKALIEDLKAVYKKIGKIPSRERYDKEGKYNSCTIDRRWGWSKILIRIFKEKARKTPQKLELKKCLNCEEETLNLKFCSRHCAATYNNKLRERPPILCERCEKKLDYRYKNVLCSSCKKIYSIEKLGEKTLGEIRRLPSFTVHRHVRVRNHADRVMRYYNLKVNYCLFCDYKNHVQLCHIKDIGDFPDSAKLKEINDPANLVYLCPNHHWDLDHGFLSDKEMSTIRSRSLIMQLSASEGI